LKYTKNYKSKYNYHLKFQEHISRKVKKYSSNIKQLTENIEIAKEICEMILSDEKLNKKRLLNYYLTDAIDLWFSKENPRFILSNLLPEQSEKEIICGLDSYPFHDKEDIIERGFYILEGSKSKFKNRNQWEGDDLLRAIENLTYNELKITTYLFIQAINKTQKYWEKNIIKKR
jgi:hypothetical protein